MLLRKASITSVLAIILFAPNLLLAQTMAPHPRLHITAARLTRMKAAWGVSAVAKAVKAQADAVTASGAGDNDAMASAALAYRITGTVAYATGAIKCALAIANNPSYQGTPPLSSDSGLPYKTVLGNMAEVYDYCYDQLSATDKSVLAKWMMDRADWVWPETNTARIGAWATNSPSNNYFIGFLSTWEAALACYGDEPRAATHYNLARNTKWPLLKAYLDGWAKGGYQPESTNYDIASTFNISRYVDAQRTATGEDLTISEPWVADSVLWELNATSPDMRQFYPIGSQSRISMPFLSDYNRTRVEAAASTSGNATVLGYARWWLDHITPAQTTWTQSIYYDLLYNPTDVTAIDYRAALPTSYYAAGSGLLLSRTDWSSSATWWGVWSGPLQESHQDPDCNGFQVYKGGDWIVPSANVYSSSGILGEWYGTIAFNNVTIGGHGQRLSPGVSGKVLVHEVGADYVYWQGQAAPCYTADTPITHVTQNFATDVTRKIIYIPGADIFVISDRVAKVNTADATEFHLHSKNLPVVSGSNCTWNNGSSQATLTSPVAAAIVPENSGSGGALSSYRIDVVNSGGSATDRLVNVLQVTPLAGAPLPVSQISSSTHNVVQVGRWIVATGKTESITGPVQFTIPSSSQPTEILVCDLAPNTAYQANGVSTVAGTLRFSAPAGTTSISLTPGNAAPTLASIAISPSSATLQTGASAQFTASGVYSDNSTQPLTGVIWTATGGTVSSSGLYSAGSVAGQFAISAVSGGITGSASVNLTQPVIDYKALWNADEATIVSLKAQLATLQAKYDALVAAIKAALGIP